VAGKGKRAGRQTLLQLGMSEAAADAVLHSPASQAAVKLIQTYYEDLQVGAAMSFWHSRLEMYVVT
jgi:hypothetical protein